MERLVPLIPVEKQALVEKALLETFDTITLEEATLLTGGLSSALVFKIQIEGKAYVLRVVMLRDGLRDPKREYQCLNLASTARIAPAVRYTNAQDGVSISEFISSERFSSELWLPVARAIKSIHALPLFPPLIGFVNGIDMFIGQFKTNALFSPHLTEEHFRYYARIQADYPRHDPDLVSSHNDLNPGNLLFDGEKLWIIDWESGFCNDRYVDLAVAATFFHPTPENEELFLRAYFGEELDDYRRNRFFLMRQVCLMYYAMVFLNLAATQLPPGTQLDQNMDSPTPQEFREMMRAGEISLGTLEHQILYGKVMFNESLRQMKSPRFERALNAVKSCE